MASFVLDPGHGGTRAEGNSSPYGSRAGDGLTEKDLTLDISTRVARHLGDEAILTRQDDRNLSLGARARVAAANRPQGFVSIHADLGAEPSVWVHDEATPDSLALAHRVARSLGPQGQVGVRQAQLAVLSPAHTGGVAACLIELGDVADAATYGSLRSESAREALAHRIATGLAGERRYGVRAVPVPPWYAALHGQVTALAESASLESAFTPLWRALKARTPATYHEAGYLADLLAALAAKAKAKADRTPGRTSHALPGSSGAAMAQRARLSAEVSARLQQLQVQYQRELITDYRRRLLTCLVPNMAPNTIKKIMARIGTPHNAAGGVTAQRQADKALLEQLTGVQRGAIYAALKPAVLALMDDPLAGRAAMEHLVWLHPDLVMEPLDGGTSGVWRAPRNPTSDVVLKPVRFELPPDPHTHRGAKAGFMPGRSARNETAAFELDQILGELLTPHQGNGFAGVPRCSIRMVGGEECAEIEFLQDVRTLKIPEEANPPTHTVRWIDDQLLAPVSRDFLIRLALFNAIAGEEDFWEVLARRTAPLNMHCTDNTFKFGDQIVATPQSGPGDETDLVRTEPLLEAQYNVVLPPVYHTFVLNLNANTIITELENRVPQLTASCLLELRLRIWYIQKAVRSGWTIRNMFRGLKGRLWQNYEEACAGMAFTRQFTPSNANPGPLPSWATLVGHLETTFNAAPFAP